MAATTGGPIVRFGTKWPSITSTCSRSASGATASMASARAAKSADRIDGAIRTTLRTLSRRAEPQDEHAVGSDRLREQAGAPAGPIPRRTGGLQRFPFGMARRQPGVDLDRLRGRQRADAVDHRPAGA